MSELPEDAAVIAQRLHLATGFLANERDWVVAHLAALGSRLRSFRDDQVDLEIRLEDRRGVEQRVTLECWINRTPRLHLVATSSEPELPAALNEVRTELIRQVDEANRRTEPRSHRALRSVPALPEFDQPRTEADPVHDDEPEKSTNQLAVWRELVDALDKLDVAWKNAQPAKPGTSQLPGNIAVALAAAVEHGATAISGVTDILVAQHDSGETFQQVALELGHAVDQWPTGR